MRYKLTLGDEDGMFDKLCNHAQVDLVKIAARVDEDDGTGWPQQRGVSDLQQLIVVHTAFVEVQAAVGFLQHRLIHFTGHHEALPAESTLRSCNVHRHFYLERDIEMPIVNPQRRPSQSRSRLALACRIPFACQFPLSGAYKTCQARVRRADSVPSPRAPLLLSSYNVHLEDILLRLDFRCFRLCLFVCFLAI